MTKIKPNPNWPTRRAPKAEREAFAKKRFARAPIARALFLGDPEPLIEKMKEKGLKLASVAEVLVHMVGARQPGRREQRKRVRILQRTVQVTTGQLRSAADENNARRAAWRVNTSTKKVESDVGKNIRHDVMREFGIPAWAEQFLINAQRRKEKPRKQIDC